MESITDQSIVGSIMDRSVYYENRFIKIKMLIYSSCSIRIDSTKNLYKTQLNMYAMIPKCNFEHYNHYVIHIILILVVRLQYKNYVCEITLVNFLIVIVKTKQVIYKFSITS